MKRRFVLALLLLSSAGFAQNADKKQKPAIDPDEAYKQYCFRCHGATRKYSTWVNSSAMMHMRVFANLPPDVSKAVLGYVNGEAPAPNPPSQTAKPGANNSH
jgi:hypothetical protein